MEYLGLETIKHAYAESMVELDDIARAQEVMAKKITEPIYEGYAIHPEAEPNKKALNTALTEIAIDIKALDLEITNAAANYASLVDAVNERLKAVDDTLAREEARIQDMNMICGNFKDANSISTLAAKHFHGTFGHPEDDVFMAQVTDTQYASFIVNEVAGNGYEGNSYVVDKKTQELKTKKFFTGKHLSITDVDTATCYEYSRITTGGNDSSLPSFINRDNEEARCIISLQASKEPCGMLRIRTNQHEVLESVKYCRDDSGHFEEALSSNIEMNAPDKKYDEPDYAHGSGIICFPASKHIKVQLSSKGTTDDTIGKQDKKGNLTIYKDAKRHVVQVQDIVGLNGSFSTAQMDSIELVEQPVDSISIFVNEYIPPSYPQFGSYVEYFLTVNGVRQEIVPINSSRSGIKVIRYSNYLSTDAYIKHIREPIKSAKLSIKIVPYQNSSPVLSNLKICYGKAVPK